MIVFGAGIVVSNRLLANLVETNFESQSPIWVSFMLCAFGITIASTGFGAIFMLALEKKENQAWEDEEDEENEGDD